MDDKHLFDFSSQSLKSISVRFVLFIFETEMKNCLIIAHTKCNQFAKFRLCSVKLIAQFAHFVFIISIFFLSIFNYFDAFEKRQYKIEYLKGLNIKLKYFLYFLDSLTQRTKCTSISNGSRA